MSDRFHRAAKDGLLDILKEATRRDCNARDDDGMTPTLWASFEGHLDALRLLVGRGGDPEKWDHYGNTALHFASARGHMNCVTFLVSYGVNLFAKDIDFHTAKDLAAMNNRQDILRYLDEQAAKQQRTDPKKVKAQTEKATKDAEKIVADFSKVQEKAQKLAEKEKKRLEKERKRMEEKGQISLADDELIEPATLIPRASVSTDVRRDSRLVYAQSHKFSDYVNPKEEKDKIRLPVSAVYKKVQQQRKKLQGTLSQATRASFSNAPLTNGGPTEEEPEFKIGAIEGGKRSVRSISGLRRDSEILYVPKYDDVNGKRAGLDGVFTENERRTQRKSFAGVPTGRILTDTTNKVDEDALPYQTIRGSIFERPGFGGLAFRHSVAAFADKQQSNTSNKNTGRSSVDGTRSSDTRNKPNEYDHDDIDTDESEEEEMPPIYFFLAAIGLEEFISAFLKEKFDLDSLMLVSEKDLIDMNIPRGHRLKLMRAIAERKEALEPEQQTTADEVEDSHL